jgi:hypothetical protein
MKWQKKRLKTDQPGLPAFAIGRLVDHDIETGKDKWYHCGCGTFFSFLSLPFYNVGFIFRLYLTKFE